MLSRLAIACYRHRRRVLLAWVALVVAAVIVGPGLAGRWSNSSRLPGTDSQAAQDVLAAQFPAQAGEGDAAVFAGIAGHRAAAQEFLARIGRQPGVTSVGQIQVAPRGDVAYAPFTLADNPSSHPGQTATAIEHLARPSGLTVAFSGDSFESGSAPKGDVIGVVAALVVLLVVFGSVLAAGLPVVIALAGIGVAIPLIGIAAHVVPSPNFTDQVAALVGIGVGIDYTLLVVTRYRAALSRHGCARGGGGGGSVHRRAVRDLGRLDGGRLPHGPVLDGRVHFRRPGGGSRAGGADRGGGHPHPATGAARIRGQPDVQAVQSGGRTRRRPAPDPFRRRQPPVSLVGRSPVGLASLGMVALLVLAAPALHLHLGTADAGTDPPGSTTHQAYEMAVRGFGPGSVAPITVVAQTPSSGTHPGGTPAGPAVRALVSALEGTPGVTSVAAPRFSPSGTTAVVQVTPAWGPADRHTAALIDRLRHDTLPAVEHQTGLTAHVGGETAGNVDFASLTAKRLPFLLLGVLTISFLLLLVGFRSIAVAAQAIVLNLLSVGAAYGIVVAVFQWGWGAGLTGAPAGPGSPVDPDHAVRHHLRPVHGLRGLRHRGDSRRPRPAPQRQAGGGRRTRLHGRGHHRRRPDHGARVRQLRDLQQPGSQGHRSGTGGSHRGGRIHHPAPDRPGHHDHPGPGGLVVPGWLDRLLGRDGTRAADPTASPVASRAGVPALTLPSGSPRRSR